jgi:thiol-disulfide isomerase/thioredoxin
LYSVGWNVPSPAESYQDIPTEIDTLIHMKKSIVFFLILSFQLVQAETIGKVGVESPEVSFNTILNFKRTSAKLSDFKSKVVIIDFWATWCSNCIEAFPHLDSLQNRFKDDLQVLTVTDEPKERIKRYLSNHPMSLSVVIDTSRFINELFPHKVIPHTILIDKSGVVRAITTPKELTEKVIGDLIAGHSITIPEKIDKQKKNPMNAYTLDDNVQFLTMVEPNREDLDEVFSQAGLEQFFLRSVVATNTTIGSLFESAYDFPRKSRTVIRVRDSTKFESTQSNKYCFVLVVPENDGPNRMQIMQQQLEQVFPYKAQVLEKMMPVKLLKLIEGKKTNLTAKKDSSGMSWFSISGDGLLLTNSSINGIAKFAESRLKQPVINETGLTERYDLTLESYEDEVQNLNGELRKLGLELVDAQRTIKTLVITDK